MHLVQELNAITVHLKNTSAQRWISNIYIHWNVMRLSPFEHKQVGIERAQYQMTFLLLTLLLLLNSIIFIIIIT